MSSDIGPAVAASIKARQSGRFYANATLAFPCGHERSEANTRIIKSTGRVRCRECVRRYMRESIKRVRAAHGRKV